MSGRVEIREPGMHAILATRTNPSVKADEGLDGLHTHLLLRRILRSPGALRTIRRESLDLGFQAWTRAASDDELAALLVEEVDRGRLLIDDLEPDAPGAEEEEADYFPRNMRPEHVLAFKEAAARYNVFILVRETNLASLLHVGQLYATPKPLDCKPKTADNDFTHTSGRKSVAGLVVDPTIAGPEAFGPLKYPKAVSEWQRFAKTMIRPEVATLQKQKRTTWIVGGRYFVDLDPASERYGALKLTPTGLVSAAKYIHGDFDLYGIIPADDPSRNIRVMEERLGQKHARSPEFFDVQHYINRRVGAPMIQHGAAESYEDQHSDEGIDIFHPGGKITRADSSKELESLYKAWFGERKLFTKSGPVEIVRGQFVTPA